ncbi:MAG: hypothetical protein GF329_17975 [Candidatus Lokiarchaeota archaeon]|nr:hypothetical protein [Candidatus Lokiarchaeota archaeon]
MSWNWIISRIARQFGIDINSLLFHFLYREIAKSLYDNVEVEKVPEIMFEIGGKASLDSAERHPTIFKFVSPGTGKEILKYIKMLWYTVFGTDMEYEIINDDFEDSDYLDLYIDNCPICQGYYSEDEDISRDKMEEIFGKSGYACLLIGMMTSVGNFMLEMKDIPYTMEIQETECQALGAERMRIRATLHPKEKTDVESEKEYQPESKAEEEPV